MAICPWPFRAKGLIVLVSPNYYYSGITRQMSSCRIIKETICEAVKLIRLLFPEIYMTHFQLSVIQGIRLPKPINVVIFHVSFLRQILHKSHCIIVSQNLMVSQPVFSKL